jgi:hypothetical protein
MKQEFPFLNSIPNSESDVLCTLCGSKFSIATKGRTNIKEHIGTQKHIKGENTVNANNSISSFLTDQPGKLELQGKELALAYHSAKHGLSTRSSACTSQIINKMFDPSFTCGATKLSALVREVKFEL